MSKYYVIPQKSVGEGGDIYFRQHPQGKGWYCLYLDGKFHGVVCKSTFGHWTAISHSPRLDFPRMFTGFATRFAAATFIIRHYGYWPEG